MPDIVARAGYVLKGRILLSDGLAMPAGMRVNQLADGMPDRQSVIFAPDGSYEFRGLAEGIYTLYPAAPGN